MKLILSRIINITNRILCYFGLHIEYCVKNQEHVLIYKCLICNKEWKEDNREIHD